MRTTANCIVLASTFLTAALGCASRGADAKKTSSDGFLERFGEDERDFVSEGENPYFSLKPGHTLELKGKEDGKPLSLVIHVLPQTRRFGSVETRVVEERESHDGVIVEISRNYFAISKRTRNVYYFGEDVDMYKNGKVVNHEGSWLHGEHGARFGLFMPGTAAVGERFQQEIAPGAAMDRCEIVSVSETVETPAGIFQNCVKVKETTPLEPDAVEYKYYAPGVGLLVDGSARLVKTGAAR